MPPPQPPDPTPGPGPGPGPGFVLGQTTDMTSGEHGPLGPTTDSAPARGRGTVIGHAPDGAASDAPGGEEGQRPAERTVPVGVPPESPPEAARTPGQGTRSLAHPPAAADHTAALSPRAPEQGSRTNGTPRPPVLSPNPTSAAAAAGARGTPAANGSTGAVVRATTTVSAGAGSRTTATDNGSARTAALGASPANSGATSVPFGLEAGSGNGGTVVRVQAGSSGNGGTVTRAQAGAGGNSGSVTRGPAVGAGSTGSATRSPAVGAGRAGAVTRSAGSGAGAGRAGRGPVAGGGASVARKAGGDEASVVRTAGGGAGAAPEIRQAAAGGASPRAGRPRHKAFRPRAAGPLVVADAAAAVVGALVGRPGMAPWLLVPLVVCLVAVVRRQGLYRPGFAPAAFDEVPALAPAAASAWGLVAVAAAARAPGRAFGWAELLTAVAVTVLGQCMLRALVYGARRRHARLHPGSTLIVGGDAAVRQVVAVLHAHPEYGMHPVGIAATGQVPGQEQGPGPGHGTAPDDFPLPVLTGHGDITRAVIQNSVRYAVVTGPRTPDARTTATVRLLAAQGACVWQVGPTPGGRPGTVAPGHLWGFACRRLDPYPRPPHGRWGKRALDVVLASAALLALAPVLAVCALAVRLADGPGVLFRQERIGLGGRPFTLLKFRTLRPSDPGESATRWSIAHDRRVSGVGRLLRRTSLDELPQFWNVLRGDMSLVGPRPERPFFVEQFSQTHPGYRDRHRMPVGITGLAQVHGLRGDTSIADRARFDNHYIDSWSLWQDVRILLRTATSLFRFGGS
nr:exopolysaccharide biosynthesis polyprenyl glycosylphosphotransferase [Actinacidiphila alni]